MERNDELINLVFERIKADPNRWNQGFWFDGQCGTTACFAGHALLASGFRSVRVDTEAIEIPAEWHGMPLMTFELVDPEGRLVRDFSDRAAALLGLNVNEADELFGSSAKTVEALKSVITFIQSNDLRRVA